MSKFIGRRVEAAIGIETSRGVGIAPQYSLGKIDFSVFDKTVDVRDDSNSKTLSGCGKSSYASDSKFVTINIWEHSSDYITI